MQRNIKSAVMERSIILGSRILSSAAIVRLWCDVSDPASCPRIIHVKHVRIIG
jgi:hypothetical protein